MADFFDDAGQDFSAKDSRETDAQYHWQHIPFGYELVYTDTELRLYGDYSADMADVLHHSGGHWNPELLAYILPLGRAAQIDLTLKKYQQQIQGFEQALAKLIEHASEQENEREQQRRQRAVANRKKVIVDQYQAGDRVSGHTILDFGRHWQEYPGLVWQFHNKGKCSQCQSFRGVNSEQWCQSCAAQQQQIAAVTYCYAYFD